ncbi:MAG: class I SAM-dependent methyltransferase [Rhodovarius sp.]|nr:class I SAM-dependent methyltransferase [Rhodovarius sp.]
MNADALRSYLRTHFNDVQGWSSPWLWQLIGPLAARQAALGLRAPVAEIGVFQGKFFIGLTLLQGVPRGNHAIDVFDMQAFNLDKAGAGDLKAFQANLARCGVPAESVTILRADSMTLTDQQLNAIRAHTGGFSFFSVDGCHLPQHTVNDIMAAMRVTAPQGIIFVDDFTNQDWPGVQEGVARLYLLDTPRFVPLAVIHNKLVLCHLSWHAQWLDWMRSALRRQAGLVIKEVTMYGYTCLSLKPDTSRGLAYLDDPAWLAVE